MIALASMVAGVIIAAAIYLTLLGYPPCQQ